MPYIFENKTTGKKYISTNDNKGIEIAFNHVLRGENIDNYKYGYCNYYQSDFFDINNENHTIAFYHNDFQRMYNEGYLIIPNTQKIIDNTIVDKTNYELLNENIITQIQYDERVNVLKLQKQNELKIHRSQLLRDWDFIVIRHNEEKEKGAGQKLGNTQYDEVLTWRQALRDITTDTTYINDPDNFMMPVKPLFLDNL